MMWVENSLSISIQYNRQAASFVSHHHISQSNKHQLFQCFLSLICARIVKVIPSSIAVLVDSVSLRDSRIDKNPIVVCPLLLLSIAFRVVHSWSAVPFVDISLIGTCWSVMTISATWYCQCNAIVRLFGVNSRSIKMLTNLFMPHTPTEHILWYFNVTNRLHCNCECDKNWNANHIRNLVAVNKHISLHLYTHTHHTHLESFWIYNTYMYRNFHIQNKIEPNSFEWQRTLQRHIQTTIEIDTHLAVTFCKRLKHTRHVRVTQYQKVL